MSMYEIEGLVENSIRVIDNAKNETFNIKNLIWNLYANVQNKFDCSHTHFRVMDILLKNSFTYKITIKEHPDYASYNTYFEELKNKDFEFINKHPTLRWDEKTNPETCYYRKNENAIFFDYGSILWERLLKSNEKAPANIDIFEIALIIMRTAERLDDTSLIYEWYAFTLNFYDWFSNNREFEVLKATYFIEMKEIFFRSKANLNKQDHHGTLTILSLDQLNENNSYFDKSYLKVWTWFVINN